MRDDYQKFLLQSEDDRRGVFNATAQELGVLPSYIEKDFWVCLTLDILFNSQELKSHKMLFKGGTALSKVYGLINRFSEDIDIVIFRDDLGFNGDTDPTNRELNLSNNKRNELFRKLRESCQSFMDEDLTETLKNATVVFGCSIYADPDDIDRQTTLLQYKSLFEVADYIKPIVKIEGGARSGISPHQTKFVKPYISKLVSGFISDLSVSGVVTIHPMRTFWEKVLILHGLHCGYRDEKRIPGEANRLSRHYYDVAMLSKSSIGAEALTNIDLLHEVREHNLIAFNQKWKCFDRAFPGEINIIPQPELVAVLAKDYNAMSGMIMGDVPSFESVIDEIIRLSESINNLSDDNNDKDAPSITYVTKIKL